MFFLLAAEHDYLLDSPAFLKELSKFLKPERSKRKIQKNCGTYPFPCNTLNPPPLCCIVKRVQ